MPQCRRDQTRFAQLLFAIIVVESILVIILMTWEHRSAERLAEEKRQRRGRLKRDIIDNVNYLIPENEGRKPFIDIWSDEDHRRMKSQSSGKENMMMNMKDSRHRLEADGGIKSFDSNVYNSRQGLAVLDVDAVEKETGQKGGRDKWKDGTPQTEDSKYFPGRKKSSDGHHGMKSNLLMSLFRRNEDKKVNSELHDKGFDLHGSML